MIERRTGGEPTLMMWAMPPDEFGAWGQWAGALVSAIAVVIALWVTLRDSRRHLLEKADQRAAQARTITARVEEIRGSDIEERFRIFGAYGSIQIIVVENHGNLPVTGVAIHQVHREDPWGKERWFLMEGPDEVTHEGGEAGYLLRSVLGPGQRAASPILTFPGDRFNESDSLRLWERLCFDSDVRNMTVDITFVDAQGFRWSRLDNGEPSQLLGDYLVEHVVRTTWRRGWPRWEIWKQKRRLRS
jgi:hypothetical protein